MVTVSVALPVVVIPDPAAIVSVFPFEIVWLEPLDPATVKLVIPLSISTKALPLKTRSLLVLVLKYKSPEVKAAPSLSTDGSEDFDPK